MHTTPSTPESFIDLETQCGTWPDPQRNMPLWRRVRAKMFRSKLKSKIEYPEDCSEIDYQVMYRDTPLLKLGVWMIAFFLYEVAIRNVVLWLGVRCEMKERELGHSYHHPLDCFAALAGSILTTAAAFLVGHGYNGLRATRELMERVRHTALSLAYAFLKMARVPEGVHWHGELQLVVYECLALLTAHPVAILHQVRGNTCEPAVTEHCQQVAYKLKELYDGARIMVKPPHATWQPMVGHGGDPKQPVRVEYFFELLSLHLESDFSQHCRKSGVPSMVPQHIIYQLRNHIENLVDSHCLDPSRAPIVREYVDMLALSGRECTVYADCDVAPICALWTVDICCRLMALSFPMRRCSWLTTTVGVDLLVRMGLLAVASATAMLLLAEMWSFWDPFGKGMNTFSWTLGIASEIDNMLNEFYENETKVPVREHRFLYPSSESCSTATMTTTTGSAREGWTSGSSDGSDDVHG